MIDKIMLNRFLEFNRIHFIHFFVFFIILLLGSNFFPYYFTFTDSIPFIFLGIGVLYSGIFWILSVVHEKYPQKFSSNQIQEVFFGVYGFTFCLTLLSFFFKMISIYGVQQIFLSGALLSWVIILGIAALLFEEHDHQEHDYPKRIAAKIILKPEVRILTSQGIAILLGVFIYIRSYYYGLPSIVLSVFFGMIIFLISSILFQEHLREYYYK